MAEFEAITTQEAFDNAIKARLDRNTDTVKKQFEGYISPDDFKTKTADLNGKITDLTGKLANVSASFLIASSVSPESLFASS